MALRICLLMLRSAGFMFCCSAVTAPLLVSPWLLLELSGAGCWSCWTVPATSAALKNSVAPRSERHLPIFDAEFILRSPSRFACGTGLQRLSRVWKFFAALLHAD